MLVTIEQELGEDFPIDIRIRLAELNFFLLLPDFANFLPCWLAQFC